MTAARFNLENAISLNIYLLKMLGLWPTDQFKCDFYRVYGVTVVSILCSFFVCEVVQLYRTITNLDVFFTVLGTFLAHSLYMVKICTIFFNSRRINRMLSAMKAEAFQPARSSDVQFVGTNFFLWRKFNRIFMANIGLTIVLWVLMPIMTGGIKRCEFATMVFYPFPCDNKLRYFGVYLYENFILISVTAGGFNVDMIKFAFFFAIEMQFKLIYHRLRRFTQGNFGQNLSNCIKHYQKLTRFVIQLNHFGNFLLFCQFFLSTVIISLIVFQAFAMSKEKGGDFIFYSRIITAISYLLQIFAYCWFGTKIESTSNMLSYALFQSPWINQSLIVKRCLQMFTLVCQAPIKLSGYKLFYLSLDAFIKIMKSAWSFLMILQQAATDEEL